MMKLRRVLAGAALLALVSLPTGAQEPPAQPPEYPGYPRAYLDLQVRPQDDFCAYAVGGYQRLHPIPPDQDSMGLYPQVREEVQAALHGILENLPPAPDGSIEQKLGDFYRSGMETRAAEAAGMEPLRPYLAEIDRIRSRRELIREMARLRRQGLETVFELRAVPDFRRPDAVVGEADQGGLGLPSKDYYVDPNRASLRQAYLRHVARVFALAEVPAPGAGTLIGLAQPGAPAAQRSNLAAAAPSEAERSAQVVGKLETALAQGSLAPAQMHDPEARLRLMSRAELRETYPGFDWGLFLDGLGLERVDSLYLAPQGFFAQLSQLMEQVPLADWKVYLRWKVLNSTGAWLAPLEEEHFQFSRQLTGLQQKPERWKRVVAVTDRYLGMALGKLFVGRRFPPEARARAQQLLDSLRSELGERIRSGWMTLATKQEALAKLQALDIQLGYPDRWRVYSGLPVEKGSFFSNLMRARAWSAREELDRIGRPLDRSLWQTTPSTVNAFYDPARNQLCLPAGQLQPPFFDPEADDASNYGACGVLMAHELSHAFDDQGAQFDARGELRSWWAPQDRERFQGLTGRLAAQMSEYSFEGQHTQGKLVVGEALADLAGVQLALGALRRSRAGLPAQATLDGFSETQRFFLAYALFRGTQLRPQAAHAQLTSDPHPLGAFRVNAPLSNLPDFYQAFDCRPGDAMMRVPNQRINLWQP